MSQSISRRSFLKCAGSGAVSLAAALLTGVCAAAQQPCLAGEPALLDGKAAVELLGYAPAPELGGVLVYLSVENLSAASLPVDTSYLQSRGLRTREQLYSMGTGVAAACNGQSVTCGSFAAPLQRDRGRCFGVHPEPCRRTRCAAALLLRRAGGLADPCADLAPGFCRRAQRHLYGAPRCRRSRSGPRAHHPRRGRQRGGSVTAYQKSHCTKCVQWLFFVENLSVIAARCQLPRRGSFLSSSGSYE